MSRIKHSAHRPTTLRSGSLLLAATLATLLGGGCIIEEEIGDESMCNAGDRRDCSCSDGSLGYRVCQKDEQAYSACKCGPEGGGDGTTTGSDDGTTTSSDDDPGTPPPSSPPSSSCSLTCGSGSFSYSCGSGSSSSSYSYCSNGKVASVVVSYSNGHKVTCTLSCSGSSGSCHDDTGESCSL